MDKAVWQKAKNQDMGVQQIIAFLDHLEEDRHNQIGTRNAALPPCTASSVILQEYTPRCLISASGS